MRIALLALLAFALLCAPARAEIRLIDPATGATTTLVSDVYARLLGWVGDAFVVEDDRNGRRSRVAPDGSLRRAPELDGAGAIGSRGQTLRETRRGFELRAPDGRVAGRIPFELSISDDLEPAWSPDATRLAIIAGGRLKIYESATAALVADWPAEDGHLGPQAWAPDGTALAYFTYRNAVRIDIASGVATKLGRANHAAWSASGQIALSRDKSIAVPGTGGIHAVPGRYVGAQWSPDGRTLAFVAERQSEECFSPVDGVAAAAPGETPRMLVEPSSRAIGALAWAADGRLAVRRQPDFRNAPRGTRHRWPKHVARDYSMRSRGGNTAVRQVLLRAARSLKAGAEREPVLARVRRDMVSIQERYDEVDEPLAREPIEHELDRWLRAAGFEPVEATEEFMC